MNKQHVYDLLTKAEGTLKSINQDDTSYDLILSLVEDARKMLPDIQGELDSSQEEVYKRLEVAVGP